MFVERWCESTQAEPLTSNPRKYSVRMAFLCFKDSVVLTFFPLFVYFVLGVYDGPFDVHRAMGTVVLARPLDAETQSLYNMTVQVNDGTNTATTQVCLSCDRLCDYSCLSKVLLNISRVLP